MSRSQPAPGGPPPEPDEPLLFGRLPRRATLRFLLLVALVAGALVAARFTPLGELLDRETLLATLTRLREAWWVPLLLIGLYLLLCPIGLPATPLMFAGGIVFGAVWGTLYNYIGCLGAGIIGYFLARALGTDLLHHLVGGRLRRVERLLARHGFWYLVGCRFLPIPYPAVNFAMALTGVKPGTFVVTTALGLAPAIAIWTYFASALYRAAQEGGGQRGLTTSLVAAIVLLIAVTLVPAWLNARRRRKRYSELTAERAQAGARSRGETAGPQEESASRPPGEAAQAD